MRQVEKSPERTGSFISIEVVEVAAELAEVES
jgi:hypothetical protein